MLRRGHSVRVRFLVPLVCVGLLLVPFGLALPAGSAAVTPPGTLWTAATAAEGNDRTSVVFANGTIAAAAVGPVTVLDTLNTGTATTFPVPGSSGVSLFAAQHAGPQFALAARMEITEIGAFLNNYCGVGGNPPCTLPLTVEIRASVGGVPDKDHIIASFALTDDGNPQLYSYESAQPGLVLDPGTYFALFTPQGPDFGALLGHASPNYAAGQAPLGVVNPGTSGVIGDTNAFQAVRILGTELTPSQLAFTTQPGDGVDGAALARQPVVAVEDAMGRAVTTYTAPVALTVTPGTGSPSGSVSCDANPVNAVAGIATFSGCMVDTAGKDYTLTAVTDGLVVASDPFDVGSAVTPLPTRIWGVDAIGTALAVSGHEFPKPGSAQAAVIARSDFYSDALAGGPLAAQAGGPLLITPGASEASSLDPRVVTELQRVLPAARVVYLLGGPLALASELDGQLAALGYQPVRVAGDTLYGTAVAIAQRLGNPKTIFEATGTNFPDALSAVPAAIKTDGAILLTDGPSQAPETAAYLAEHPTDRRYAIGGPLAAAGADPDATPVYGQDLYGTSAAVAITFFPNAAVYGTATGLDYPDALTGGVFMATGGRMGPVLLVDTDAPLPEPIDGYLATLALGTPGYVFGGPLAVADNVLTAIQAAIG